MSALAALVRRELGAVRKERTIVIAIVIQLFIATFSSSILIGLVSYYDPDSIGYNARTAIRVGILGDNSSPLARFLSTRAIRVRTLATPAEAENAFRVGRVDALVYLPADSGDNPVELKLFIPKSESRATVILMVLKEPLKAYENYLRTERGVQIRYTELRNVPSTSFEFLYSTIIPILLFFPAFIAGSMTVDSISEEFENHTLDTLLSAPVSLEAILGSKVIAALLLAVVQCLLWLVLLRLNGIVIHNPAQALLLSTIVAAILAVSAALVSMFFKDRERSQFVYSLLILVAASGGQLLGISPIIALTRLVADDPRTSVMDLVPYGLLSLVLLALLLYAARKPLTANN